MKILFVVEHFPCVSETFVLNQVTGLIDLGHDVTVYAVGKPSAAVIHADIERYALLERTWSGADVPQAKLERSRRALSALPALIDASGWRALRAFDVRRHGLRAINLAFLYSCLALLGRETRFDAIHCHFADKGELALSWREMGLLKGSLAAVFHAHELAALDDAEGRRRYGALLRSDALLLPVSERWRERLLRWGAAPQRTIVHHMGVDLDRFPFAPRAHAADSVVEILTVGRLTEQKGYEYALRAVAQLRAMTDRPVRYTIIGAGEQEGSLRRLAGALGIAGSVEFAGPQAHEAVVEALRRSHVFLLPSVTADNGFQEGIPVALMEAMACGVPVVTTRHSGIPELVEHGVSGFLAEERDAAALAHYLRAIIDGAGLSARLARAARMRIEAEFDVRALNRRLSRLLASHAAGARDPRGEPGSAAPDRRGRDAADHRVLGHVFRHDGAGGDDRLRSDSDPRQDDRGNAEPGAAFDHDVALQARAGGPPAFGVDAMRAGTDVHARSDVDAAADADTRSRADHRAGADPRVVADREPAGAEHGDRRADADVAPELRAGEPQQ